MDCVFRVPALDRVAIDRTDAAADLETRDEVVSLISNVGADFVMKYYL